MTITVPNLYLCDGCGRFLELAFYQAVALNTINKKIVESGGLPIVLKCEPCIEVRK
jgi:hypothetical protein